MTRRGQKLFSVRRGSGADDFRLDYFSGSGAGGQNRNKVQACVRLTHPASGVRVTAQRERSRRANEAAALRQLATHPTFVLWARARAGGEAEARAREEREISGLIEVQLRDSAVTLVEVLARATCDMCGVALQVEVPYADEATRAEVLRAAMLKAQWVELAGDVHYCTRCARRWRRDGS